MSARSCGVSALSAIAHDDPFGLLLRHRRYPDPLELAEVTQRFPQFRTARAAAIALEMWRVGRNDAPGVLDAHDAEDPLGADDLCGLVVEAWSGAEFPEAQLGRRRWVELFRRADYPRPSRSLTLYRGAVAAQRGGMSWTADPEMARWFATRRVNFGGASAAHVYRADAPPAAVLCDVDAVEGDSGRRESEVVVLPVRLRGIERVETIRRQSLSEVAR